MAIVERKRPSIDLQFVGGAYEHNSSIISAQEAINVFPEIGQDGATPFSMVGVPGATKFSTLDRRVRGMTVAFGSLYVAAGEYVYKMDSAGVATNMGEILNDRLPVSFSYNIFELLIVSGGVGYVSASQFSDCM